MNILAQNNLGQFAAQTARAEKAENLSRAAAGADALQRQKAAQEFSSFLYLEVLKAMRAALPQEGLFADESLSRDIYTSMMDAEVARLMARRDATGFTDTVVKALDKIAPAPPPSDPSAPVTGVVSSPFGLRADPLNGKE